MRTLAVITHDDVDGFLWEFLECWMTTPALAKRWRLRLVGANALVPGEAPEAFWRDLPAADVILAFAQIAEEG